METSGNHGPGQRDTTVRGLPWLMCLTLVVASGGLGCGTVRAVLSSVGYDEELPSPGCKDATCNTPLIKSLPEHLICEKGGECPPLGNGNGLYVEEERNYCFLYMGEKRICPEAFINTANQTVLEYRDLKDGGRVHRSGPFSAIYSRPKRLPTEVKVRGLSAKKTQFILSYRFADDTEDRYATGDELTNFTFRFSVTESTILGAGEIRSEVEYLRNYEFRVTPEPDAPGAPNKHYQIRYSDLGFQDFNTPAPREWQMHCPDVAKKPEDSRLVSFLPDARVDTGNGYVQQDPNAITVACQSGAIVTCLSWGYTPWSLENGQFDHNRDYAYRSCLQAKRAAYFVGQGDGKGYTLTGTGIFMRDQYGISQKPITNLEAIWSPEGVVCINPDKLRRMQFQDAVRKKGVRRCEPAQWSDDGKLATSPEILGLQ